MNKEEKSDIEKKDQCKEEYFKIDKKVAFEQHAIDKNSAKINKLEKLIAEKSKQKMQTIEDLSQTEKSIKSMEDQRNAENQEFESERNEDKQALSILNSAEAALKDFYENKVSTQPGDEHNDVTVLDVRFLQVREEPVFKMSKEERPDAQFSHEGNHKKQANGILVLIGTLIEDLNLEIKNAEKVEKLATEEFNKQSEAAHALKSDLEDKRDNLAAAISDANKAMSDEQTLKLENVGDLKNELDYKASIQTDCDWMLGSFDERREKRAAEMEGLKQAKAFLASQHVEDYREVEAREEAAKNKKEDALISLHKSEEQKAEKSSALASIKFLGVQ